MMENKIIEILQSMHVNKNRAGAEQSAIDIWKLDPDGLELLIQIGKTKAADGRTEKTISFLRAVIFTISIFHSKDRSAFTRSQHFDDVQNLLARLALMGFNSAKLFLYELGLSDYDIYRKCLLALPQVDRLTHDKEISTREAYEEIRLSKTYSGIKGLFEDHFSLGTMDRHLFKIFRIGKKIFTVRKRKTN